ncbi:MAG: DUF552 domain-containing protein [Actinobacteria bacterium]|nr:MAG: DUF552 domain-containing protein [Actinomycetota bacterium]
MKDLWQKSLVYFGLVDEEDGAEEEFEDDDDIFGDQPYEDSPPTVRKLDRGPDIRRAQRTAALRSVSSPQVRVHIVEPRSFNDAQQIGDKFKANIPVILNLQVSDPELSKRLIDFASGLTYGLDGGMQRIAEKVFLLTPSNVEVSAEERRRLQERGFFNQL